jgi:hypothetical protein
MERDLEKMNELWNSLKQAMADRDRKLEKGLLQSGKFQEALASLLAWMDEMEDMIAHQKPPRLTSAASAGASMRPHGWTRRATPCWGAGPASA